MFALLLLLAFPTVSWTASTLGARSLSRLSSEEISALVASPDPLKSIDTTNPASHISKILIPRASGSDNNTLVKDYIVSTLKALKWHIEEDAFDGDTPIGPRHFVNVIATKDPDASRRVILSAHFDSKWFPAFPLNQFLGATDSAAPCAMMLDIAESLNGLLDKRKQHMEDGLAEDDDVADTTLQLVFFDGEEAFHDWTDTDSVYGARHLSEKWASTYVLPHTHPKRRLLGQAQTELSYIEHMVLIDLLGAKQPNIKSYFKDTAWLFDGLVSAEKKLGDAGAFTWADKGANMAKDQWKSYFTSDFAWGMISDDHVPFMQNGVSVLHVIPEPFPSVWHTIRDDASALDIPTMRRWNLMLRVFFAEYLHLKPEPHKRAQEDDDTTTTTTSSVQKSESELVRI